MIAMEKDHLTQQNLDLLESLGFRLRQKREDLGYNIEDAADRLRLSVNVIKLIEADKYGGENNTVFMRGYVRSYARLLGVSNKDVQTTFIAMGLIESSTSVDPVKFNTKQHSAKDKPMKIVTYAVIIILIILVLVWRYLNH